MGGVQSFNSKPNLRRPYVCDDSVSYETDNSVSNNQTLPPPYDIATQSLNNVPLTAKEILPEQDAFIMQRDKYYEQAYEDGCKQCIDYINTKLKTNIGKEFINVELIENGYNDPLKLLNMPLKYRDYDKTCELLIKLCDYINESYNSFKITTNKNNRSHIIIKIYYERNKSKFDSPIEKN